MPESLCTRCNGTLVSAFKARGDWSDAHGFPESFCPACNPQPPPAGAERAAIEGRTVRFRSPDIEDAAGLRIVEAQTAQAAATVECTAHLMFDADRVADVRAIIPGVIRDVRVKLGATVERGAPLFDLESLRVGEIQGQLRTSQERLLTAEANTARLSELRASQLTTARQAELAQAELAAARAESRSAEAMLRMAGAERADPAGRYTLRAPKAGVLVRHPAVFGLLATESTSLATIADTSVMWALCDVPEAQASRVRVGQSADVTVDGGEPLTVRGEITWVSSEVDPRTRTVSARAELPNLEGRLRANQFGWARIVTEAPRSAVTVPREAVQRVGEREVVFVRTTRGVYEPRIVQRHVHPDRRGCGQLRRAAGAGPRRHGPRGGVPVPDPQ